MWNNSIKIQLVSDMLGEKCFQENKSEDFGESTENKRIFS